MNANACDEEMQCGTVTAPPLGVHITPDGTIRECGRAGLHTAIAVFS